MIIKDFMSSHVITLKPSNTVYDAALLMDKYNIGCIIIVDDNGNLAGIMTERDIVRRVISKKLDPGSISLYEIMTKTVKTVNQGASMDEAARMMRDNHFRRLVIVDDDEKIVGIITTTDLVKSFSNAASDLLKVVSK